MSRQEFVVKINDKDVALAVRRPFNDELQEADRIAAAKIAEIIRDKKRDLLLRRELDDYLRSKGIWTQEDEDKIERLQREIKDKLVELKKGGISIMTARAIALEITQKRIDIVGAWQKRQTFDNMTIESIANQDREEYLFFCTIVYSESGERYWNDLEAMRADKGSEVFKAARLAFDKMFYGYDEQIEKTLPENIWLKKYGFVNDDMELIDRKTGEYVDKNGKLLQKKNEIIQQLEAIQTIVQPEEPFIDDETNTPIVEEKQADTNVPTVASAG